MERIVDFGDDETCLMGEVELGFVSPVFQSSSGSGECLVDQTPQTTPGGWPVAAGTLVQQQTTRGVGLPGSADATIAQALDPPGGSSALGLGSAVGGLPDPPRPGVTPGQEEQNPGVLSKKVKGLVCLLVFILLVKVILPFAIGPFVERGSPPSLDGVRGRAADYFNATRAQSDAVDAFFNEAQNVNFVLPEPDFSNIPVVATKEFALWLIATEGCNQWTQGTGEYVPSHFVECDSCIGSDLGDYSALMSATADEVVGLLRWWEQDFLSTGLSWMGPGYDGLVWMRGHDALALYNETLLSPSVLCPDHLDRNEGAGISTTLFIRDGRSDGNSTFRYVFNSDSLARITEFEGLRSYRQLASDSGLSGEVDLGIYREQWSRERERALAESAQLHRGAGLAVMADANTALLEDSIMDTVQMMKALIYSAVHTGSLWSAANPEDLLERFDRIRLQWEEAFDNSAQEFARIMGKWRAVYRLLKIFGDIINSVCILCSGVSLVPYPPDFPLPDPSVFLDDMRSIVIEAERVGLEMIEELDDAISVAKENYDLIKQSAEAEVTVIIYSQPDYLPPALSNHNVSFNRIGSRAVKTPGSVNLGLSAPDDTLLRIVLTILYYSWLLAQLVAPLLVFLLAKTVDVGIYSEGNRRDRATMTVKRLLTGMFTYRVLLVILCVTLLHYSRDTALVAARARDSGAAAARAAQNFTTADVVSSLVSGKRLQVQSLADKIGDCEELDLLFAVEPLQDDFFKYTQSALYQQSHFKIHCQWLQERLAPSADAALQGYEEAIMLINGSSVNSASETALLSSDALSESAYQLTVSSSGYIRSLLASFLVSALIDEVLWGLSWLLIVEVQWVGHVGPCSYIALKALVWGLACWGLYNYFTVAQ